MAEVIKVSILFLIVFAQVFCAVRQYECVRSGRRMVSATLIVTACSFFPLVTFLLAGSAAVAVEEKFDHSFISEEMAGAAPLLTLLLLLEGILIISTFVISIVINLVIRSSRGRG